MVGSISFLVHDLDGECVCIFCHRGRSAGITAFFFFFFFFGAVRTRNSHFFRSLFCLFVCREKVSKAIEEKQKTEVSIGDEVSRTP